ncbi:hypothetical protein [Kribbella speibonae]|uniref:Uncharacterized protein n=1 Tax=Kribbella speibonae TaxID=1572660 RepID=A0ABY2A2Y2_9ACTN|nr:hypothetical protein [Kribbella speibonae]TCC22767.1 hypothetical protein E0H58_20505 [Kribbella speibonae]
MDEFLEALRLQMVLILTIGTLQVMSVGMHGPVVLNVLAGRSRQPRGRALRWVVRLLRASLMGTSTMFHVLLSLSAGVLIAEVDKVTGVVVAVAGVASFAALFFTMVREGTRAMDELPWIMRYGDGRTTYVCAARRQAYGCLVRRAAWMLLLVPPVGYLTAPVYGLWIPLQAALAATLLIVMLAIPIGIAYHPRWFGLADFLEAVGPLFRSQSAPTAPPVRRATRIREIWEMAWVPSEFTLRVRGAHAVSDQTRVVRAVRPMRFAILRQCARLQPPSRDAFLSAADKVLAEFAALAVKPGDIRGAPALDAAIRLVVQKDVRVLDPAWAASPRIADNRAWGMWRWAAGMGAAAVAVSVATGLLSIAKEIADVLK